MAPVPAESSNQPKIPTSPVHDDAIVISGISGELPNCESFWEFTEKIYEKKNLVSSDKSRWKGIKHPELSAYCGNIGPVDVFDAQFFTVFNKLAHCTEPAARRTLEHTYQAIFDSGTCPSSLSGRHIGVYVSAALTESEKLFNCSDVPLGLVGCNNSMWANRISYWLNLKGPSLSMDGSCSGTIVALMKAYHAIAAGYCEAAIVATGKIIMHPQTSIMSSRSFPVNPDGKTKCYAANADGRTVSEAINVMYLQKYKDAKRVYAVINHVKLAYGANPNATKIENFKINRDEKNLTDFFREFYNEAGVPASEVEYVEGYGAASPEFDKMELQAMENIFCDGRTNSPLLVGSVSSNIGYTEAASAACGIFKILSAYHRGEIAATINCEHPRRDLASLQDGRMSIVNEHQGFNRTYTAVNSFSISGLNGHVLLHGNYKRKDLSKYQSDIPYLIAVSGRQTSSVEKILDDFKSRPLDPEEIVLIHDIHETPISKHLGRGFIILSSDNHNTVALNQSVDYYDGVKRPLWFVYSGMGSQCAGMGVHLMRIPIFARAIERCQKVLAPKGIDLVRIITSTDKDIFDNILHAFVGICSIQIGLTDIMRAIGMVPDKIIGHSVGELGCAYADGCLTDTETLLLAYNRGLVSVKTKFIHGSMAAIGMSYKAISRICPKDIDVACCNSSESCTISGPAESVRNFVSTLTSQGIFAKEVQCGNIPYHSRYIANAGPEFLRMCKEVIKDAKVRSDKWLSTSVPQDKQNEYHAKYCSAEYHTNNLLNKVLFEDVLRFVPSDAVLVEIAPHGLLQAILKRALPVDCRHVPLARREHSDGAQFLLEAIGKLYMEGFDPVISALYPKVEFPVSTETRPLSHLVEFAHTEKWKVCKYVYAERCYCSILQLIVTVEDDEYKYLKGNYVDGVRVFPYAASLVAVWDTLAMSLNRKLKEVSVQFMNVKCHSQPPINDQQLLRLTVTVQKGCGKFEVFHDKSIIIEGFVAMIASNKVADNKIDVAVSLNLNTEDVYKLLYERGYEYRNQFQSINGANSTMTRADILWQGNWVTFLDGIIQMNVLKNNHNGISSPNYIKRLVIDIKDHYNERFNTADGIMRAQYTELYKRTECGGVTVEDIFFRNQPLSQGNTVSLHSLDFVPFFTPEEKDVTISIHIFLQIITENMNKSHLTVYYVDAPNRVDLRKKINLLIDNLPSISVNLVNINIEELMQTESIKGKPDAIIMHDLISKKLVFEHTYKIVPPNFFIISLGVETKNLYPIKTYRPVSSYGSGQAKIELGLLKPTLTALNTTIVLIQSSTDMQKLQGIHEHLVPQQRLLVLAPNHITKELKDLIHQIKTQNKNVTFVMIDKKNPLDKELQNVPDVAFCRLKNGVWGNNYYQPLKIEDVPTKKLMTLRCPQTGNLSSLTWVEGSELSGPGVEVEVHYAGLNAKDAQRAMGESPNYVVNQGFGMDFSGVTSSGERVMGLVERGAVSSRVLALPQMLWPVPAHWSLEDAATVPLAYAHAFYCLCIKMQVWRGMKILVHGGTGALGQATISIALAIGCDVFTTVSDVRKKRFLKKLFPELIDDHIGNSRDSSFEDMVNIKTKGMGCDVIISCVKGEFKHATLRCLGRMGYTFDTAQLDCKENFYLGMNALTMERHYFTVDLSSIFQEKSFMEMKKLQLLISEGIVRGYVRPVSRVTYSAPAAVRALRLLAASRHRGRVLIDLRRHTPQLQPRISCSPDHSYLVICDKDGLGLQIADMLIKRGARKLVLNCFMTPYVKYKVQYWKKIGVRIDVISLNVLSEKSSTMTTLNQCNLLGDLEGIYVTVSNLKEGYQEIDTNLNHLNTASRKLCPKLKFFAVLTQDESEFHSIHDLMAIRAQDGLPSLILQVYPLKTFDSFKTTEGAITGLTWNNVTETLEIALSSRQNCVMAHARPTLRSSVLEEFVKLPGVKITDATDDLTQLEQIGIDLGRAQELSNVLLQKFHVSIYKDLLPQLTIGELKKLKQYPQDIQRELSGFSAFFNSVDPNEVEATHDLILMPTLVHKSELRDDEFDYEMDYLCIVPGLEGHHGRFRTLCERLKLPAVVLQWDNSHLDDTLHEMAQRLVDTMLKKLKLQDRFYLLGYEFGVPVALEVARILENQGKTGTVFMLGGTPQDICKAFEYQCQGTNQDSLQNTLVRHMYGLITGHSSYELQEQLLNTNNWTQKLEIYSKALRQKVSFSSQYAREIIEGAYARIKLLQNYNCQIETLKSKVVLMQAKLSVPAAQPLTKFSKQELIFHQLNATLPFISESLMCSNIINKYLDQIILQTFESKNQCDTVLVINNFMQMVSMD